MADEPTPRQKLALPLKVAIPIYVAGVIVNGVSMFELDAIAPLATGLQNIGVGILALSGLNGLLAARR